MAELVGNLKEFLNVTTVVEAAIILRIGVLRPIRGGDPGAHAACKIRTLDDRRSVSLKTMLPIAALPAAADGENE